MLPWWSGKFSGVVINCARLVGGEEKEQILIFDVVCWMRFVGGDFKMETRRFNFIDFPALDGPLN